MSGDKGLFFSPTRPSRSLIARTLICRKRSRESGDNRRFDFTTASSAYRKNFRNIHKCFFSALSFLSQIHAESRRRDYISAARSMRVIHRNDATISIASDIVGGRGEGRGSGSRRHSRFVLQKSIRQIIIEEMKCFPSVLISARLQSL